MKKSGEISYDALSDVQKRAAKWGLVLFVACMIGAVVSMIALFVYPVWSTPISNWKIVAVWIGATIAATTIGFNIISGRLRRVMDHSQLAPGDAPLPPDSKLCRKNDGMKQDCSHPIRLALTMLTGALFGAFFAPAVGSLQDPWMQWGPLVCITSGALVGLCVEIFRRSDEIIQYHIILAAAIILGAWILVVSFWR